MPYRWVLCPYVRDSDGGLIPKVGMIADPGQIVPGAAYQFAASDVGAGALCVVWSDNFAPLDADPQVRKLLDNDMVSGPSPLLWLRQILDGMPAGKKRAVMDLLKNNGVVTPDVEGWLRKQDLNVR